MSVLFPTTNAAGTGSRPLRRGADEVRELVGPLGVPGLTVRSDAHLEVFGHDSSVACPPIEMGGNVFPVHVRGIPPLRSAARSVPGFVT